MRDISKSSSVTGRATEENASFETALARLEEIVRRLEEGGLTLEESLNQYEQGVSLLRRCYSQLAEAEQRVILLAGEDAEGRPTLEPFETGIISESTPPKFSGHARRSALPESDEESEE
jgi:exodeoxyribonuclease VII small subunit